MIVCIPKEQHWFGGYLKQGWLSQICWIGKSVICMIVLWWNFSHSATFSPAPTTQPTTHTDLRKRNIFHKIPSKPSWENKFVTDRRIVCVYGYICVHVNITNPTIQQVILYITNSSNSACWHAKLKVGIWTL